MATDDSARASTQSALPLQGYLLLVALTFFWGTNWPAMKIALSELPVWWFRTACLLVGGIGLLLVARLSGAGIFVPKAERRNLLICALFNVIGWHLCSAYGVSLIPAGRAAIIAFTMPVWASILSSILLDEPLTRGKIVGLALGVAGLCALIGPDLIVLGTAPVGAIFMLGAALSWALGTVLLKRFDWSIPTTSLVGWQLIAAAIPITAGAVLFETVPDVSSLSTKAILAVLYVFAFPMLFCQWAYFKTVRLFPASIAAIGTLLIPVVGVYSGAVILDEVVGLRDFTGLVLICLALAAVLFIPSRKVRATPQT